MAATPGILSKCFSAMRQLPRKQATFSLKLCGRCVHNTATHGNWKKTTDEIMVRPNEFQVREGDQSKETFLEAIRIYTNRPGPRRGHVEFIYNALKYMEEFGVHKDLQAYKNILDVLPKGEYIATNMFQGNFCKNHFLGFYFRRFNIFLNLLQLNSCITLNSSTVF